MKTITVKNFAVAILFLSLMACSSSPKKPSPFKQLKVGMSKNEVQETMGERFKSAKVRESALIEGRENYHYGDNGYVWYNNEKTLEGFAVYGDPFDRDNNFKKVNIDRISSYSLAEVKSRKAYLDFEGYANLSSNEANLVYAQNKENIKRFFESKGYTFTNNPKSADVVILVKYGISNTGVQAFGTGKANYKYAHTPAMKKKKIDSPDAFLSSLSGDDEGSKAYFRMLEFLCLDNKTRGVEKKLIWSTLARSVGSSDDLRAIFPFLFYSASRIIETSKTYKDFNIPWYHTEVKQLVGMKVPSNN